MNITSKNLLQELVRQKVRPMFLEEAYKAKINSWHKIPKDNTKQTLLKENKTEEREKEDEKERGQNGNKQQKPGSLPILFS